MSRIRIEFKGEKVTYNDLSGRYGIPEDLLRGRYAKGMRDDALVAPPRGKVSASMESEEIKYKRGDLNRIRGKVKVGKQIKVPGKKRSKGKVIYKTKHFAAIDYGKWRECFPYAELDQEGVI